MGDKALLDPEDLAARLSDGDVIPIDTREPERFEAGHVPVSMPATKFASRVQPERHMPERYMKATRQLRAETVAGRLVRVIEKSSSVVRRMARHLWELTLPGPLEPPRRTGIHQRNPRV